MDKDLHNGQGIRSLSRWSCLDERADIIRALAREMPKSKGRSMTARSSAAISSVGPRDARNLRDRVRDNPYSLVSIDNP